MTPSPPTTPPARLRSTFLQAGFVLGCGIVFAALANALSPRGLALGRDYFPPASSAIAPIPPKESPLPLAATAHEFAIATREDVEAFLRDSRFVTRKYVLIDARNLASYQAGHIPGALQYDHFRPNEKLAEVVPACLNAEKVILYCHGGQCEDSIFTARLLVGYGVPAERLSIYEKGIEDWRAANLPVQGP